MKLIIFFMLICSPYIFAQVKQVPKSNDPCATAIENNCPTRITDKKMGRWSCLVKIHHTLNQACKESLIKETQHEPCLVPTMLYCPKFVKAINSRENLFCLSKHEDKLPKACKAKNSKRPDANDVKSKIQTTCKKDYATFCPDLKGDEANMCLNEQYKKNKVSAECKNVLDKFRRRKK